MGKLVLILLVIPLILLFYRLDKPLLWKDEGEVALIARNITKFALPVVWDGDYFVTAEHGQDTKFVLGHYVWSWNTHLQYYLTAASFLSLGESTSSARLPFSLMAFATVIVFFLTIKNIFPKNYRLQILSLVLLTTSVLFYLYARQARYYSLTMFLGLSTYFLFWRYHLSQKPVYLWLYFLASLFHFHSNFVLGFSFTLPLFIYPVLKRDRHLFLINLLIIGQALLWFAFFRPAAQNEGLGFYRYWNGFTVTLYKLRDYANLVNSFYFPFILLSPFLLYSLLKKRHPLMLLLLAGVVSHLITISLFLQFGQRYLATLIPILPIFTIYALAFWAKKALFPASLFIGFLVFSNLPFVISERFLHPSYLTAPVSLRSDLISFIRGLPQSYPGPLEGTIKFLTENKLTTAAVYADYEQDSLKFYLPSLTIVNKTLSFTEGVKPVDGYLNDFLAKTDIFLPRHAWGALEKIPPCERGIIISQAKKHVLNYSDIPWETMPDITYHKFHLLADDPKLTIYEVTVPLDFSRCKIN